MMKINSLGWTAGGRAILRQVNFTVERNDFVLVFGANGAGKSTLLRLMAGLLHPAAGEVLLEGRSVALHSRRELAARLSYLAQNDEFELPVLVKDILQASRYPYRSFLNRLSQADREAIVRGVEEFGLEELLPRNMQTLSGGEKRKVLLAGALIQDVPLILLDEPLNYLDPGSAASLLKGLRRLHGKGKTMVVVSHEVERFFPLANKIVALKRGEARYAGERVFSRELLRDIYGVAFRQAVCENREILFVDE